MLDDKTKKDINDCRDVLVGKVPDPKSQIEQRIRVGGWSVEEVLTTSTCVNQMDRINKNKKLKD